MNEIWAKVPGYELLYEVSSKGSIKSLKRQVKLKNGTLRWVAERVLKAKKRDNGYQFVTLSKIGNAKSFYIHRLVASVFVENPDNNKIVNHKDGNPLNNNFDNLEWVSHQQNVQHGYDTGLNSNKGATHGFAVGVIDNELGKRFDTVKEWAEARGINYNTGRNLLNGYSSIKGIKKNLIVKMSKEGNGKINDTK